MAVNLTHKLIRNLGIVHHEDYGEEFIFEYTPRTIYPEKYVTSPYIMLVWGNDYKIFATWNEATGEIPINISKPLNIHAGTYEAIVRNSGGNVWLLKINEYGFRGDAVSIGKFINGERFTIEEDGMYIIAEENLYQYDNLENSIIEFEEYDQQEYETTIIDEPIGFDDLQSTIKRHEYHGMGAEVSLGNLEFYGSAFDVIKNAYDADIDKEVLYEVTDGGTTIYSGQIDLSTTSAKRGDYKSVSVKVGEIGAKTTFNNRIDKEVDIEVPSTIDGSSVDAPEWLDLHIPTKHLLYTNIVRSKIDKRQPPSGTFEYTKRLKNKVFLPFGDDIINEFGTINTPAPYATDDISTVDPLYDADSDHVSKYGQNTKVSFEARIVATITFNRSPAYNFTYSIVAKDTFGNTLSSTVKSAGRSSTINIDASISGTLQASGQIRCYLQLIYSNPAAPEESFDIYAVVKKGTYVKMTMYDNVPETNVVANMILVHDALNVISQAISENALSVKSDWYQTPESHWNPGIIGGGALKALTNGYKIRGLFSNEDNKRNMPISFKDMIESLSALDCIGWGFSKENDETFVRVERWDWFYKDEVILILDSVNELQIDVEPDRIPTELKIGYKKYATQDQYNSIDSPHGTRTFINGIKALNKKITKESEFIADNYAIEETRRARTQVSETEETTYDENIFVFELVKTDDEYSIGHTSVNPEKVGNPDEFINAKLTPRHMASRWQDYIFATNNSTPFRFTTGEINYQAVFAVIPEETEADNITTHSLRPFVEDPSVQQAENADIANEHAKFKAEKITFSYPLTIDQYKSVLANPYGLIRITEGNAIVAEGWIMDFKYKFEDGMADFTLIAKYTN